MFLSVDISTDGDGEVSVPRPTAAVGRVMDGVPVMTDALELPVLTA